MSTYLSPLRPLKYHPPKPRAYRPMTKIRAVTTPLKLTAPRWPRASAPRTPYRRRSAFWWGFWRTMGYRAATRPSTARDNPNPSIRLDLEHSCSSSSCSCSWPYLRTDLFRIRPRLI